MAHARPLGTFKLLLLAPATSFQLLSFMMQRESIQPIVTVAVNGPDPIQVPTPQNGENLENAIFHYIDVEPRVPEELWLDKHSQEDQDRIDREGYAFVASNPHLYGPQFHIPGYNLEYINGYIITGRTMTCVERITAQAIVDDTVSRDLVLHSNALYFLDPERVDKFPVMRGFNQRFCGFYVMKLQLNRGKITGWRRHIPLSKPATRLKPKTAHKNQEAETAEGQEAAVIGVLEV
ncbi:uncharacterized protein K460DRAFT_356126 [Cucurbitaria berberidis CBS 394.84]|uniref:Uncharacterized protein n=1 Tax=Cucurbitaria berberidis CBS 394.84 TaxID=1168544 RepID=A0A9P4GIY0_9PLEO|nr:uncharacterized protein K460DRAFT_356126 [Cucurbitaria berberidis CBS 394.84]KAF1846450.1 hypothetical protein K460DRAFT_356126 [Cucurbitaria berberidis CBS 394.84]